MLSGMPYSHWQQLGKLCLVLLKYLYIVP